MSNGENVFHWLPCAVVFIVTSDGQSRDIMTATAMFVSEKESLLAVSVARYHLTEKLIGASGNFTLVIAAEDQKQLANQVGSLKGEVTDKFERFSIATIDDSSNGLVPRGSAAWMACRVENTLDIKGYRVIIARVVNQADLGKPPLVWQKNAYFGLKPA